MNECTENITICGLGSCINNDNGTFYQCVCQNGAETTGAGPNITCVGMSQAKRGHNRVFFSSVGAINMHV